LYMIWPHPEVFSWASAVVSVVLFRNARYPGAGFAAALGAMQNPPLALLAVAAFLAAWHSRGWRHALLTGLAAAPAAAPPLFSLWAFGTMNKIVATGGASLSYATADRVVGFLIDLNQGMLPHLPALFAAWLVTACVVVVRREWRGIGVFLLVMLMILLVSSTVNWNAGAAGVRRYAVWMIPLLAWLVVDHLPRGRAVTGLLVLGIALQLGIVRQRGGEEDYVAHSRLAEWVLEHHPTLYSPHPEIFVERTLGKEVGNYREHLPLTYWPESGEVTKVLFLAPTARDDWADLDVDEGWLTGIIEEFRDAIGPVYVVPPPLTFDLPDFRGSPAVLARSLSFEIIASPSSVTSPGLSLRARIENLSSATLWPRVSRSRTPLYVSYRVRRDGEVLVRKGRRSHLETKLRPGEKCDVDVFVDLPEAPGRYEIELDLVMKIVGWLGLKRRLAVSVVSGVDDGYRATVERLP